MLKVIVVSSIPISDKDSQAQFEEKLREKVLKMNKQKKHEDKILLFFSYSEKKITPLIKKNRIKGVIFQDEKQIFVLEMTDLIGKICHSLKKRTIPTFLWVEGKDYHTLNDVMVVKDVDLALKLVVKTPPVFTVY